MIEFTPTRRAVRRDTPEPAPVSGCAWIPLTKGYFVLVDAEDFPALSNYAWTATVCRRSVYAHIRRCVNGKSRLFYLHRLIMNAPDGMQVDHTDGNSLDCRKSNMRICTVKQNHRNIRKSIDSTSSRYKGVTWDKNRNRWMAKVKVNGRHVNLGRFVNEEEAALAYDAKARELFGEFARPNFDE